jgi:hypothetical protein
MIEPGFPSLSQLQVLLTVVDAGSFAAAGPAAEPGDIGHHLRDRQSRGPARLAAVRPCGDAQAGADTGRPRDRRGGADRDPQRRHAARQGEGPARRSGSRGLGRCPMSCCRPVAWSMHCRPFRRCFRPSPCDFTSKTLGAVTQLVSERTPLSASAVHCMSIRPASNASPSVTWISCPSLPPFHPLARLGTQTPGAARNHSQLVLTDRSKLTEGQDFGVISMKSWRLADLGAKHALLLGGCRLGQTCRRRWCKATSTPAGWSNSICPHGQKASTR